MTNERSALAQFLAERPQLRDKLAYQAILDNDLGTLTEVFTDGDVADRYAEDTLAEMKLDAAETADSLEV